MNRVPRRCGVCVEQGGLLGITLGQPDSCASAGPTRSQRSASIASGSIRCAVESAQIVPRAHPRSRGEHFHDRSVCHSCSGSSLLARGARAPLLRQPSRRGLIPARAGSTAGAGSRSGRRGAHPRSRGEHARAGRPSRCTGGSSPLAWGALPPLRSNRHARGLIPACAGSTVGIGHGWVLSGAHPRMRGEHFAALVNAVAPLGSSPHARGAYGRHRRHARRQGLIPACAGSIRPPTPPAARRRAHPRMRGEHTS